METVSWRRVLLATVTAIRLVGKLFLIDTQRSLLTHNNYYSRKHTTIPVDIRKLCLKTLANSSYTNFTSLTVDKGNIYWYIPNILCSQHTTLRTAFFWAITQQVMVITYRRFGTTQQSQLQGILGFLTLEDRTDRLYRNFGKKLSLLAA